MRLIIAIALFVGIYFEYQGLKACVQADSMEGILRSIYNILLLFVVAMYILMAEKCSGVLQFYY